MAVDVAAWVKAHKVPVGAGAAAAVAGLAYYRKKHPGAAASSGTTTGATIQPGTYDSTANDVYNSLAGQLGNLESQIAALTAGPGSPAAAIPPPATPAAAGGPPLPAVAAASPLGDQFPQTYDPTGVPVPQQINVPGFSGPGITVPGSNVIVSSGFLGTSGVGGGPLTAAELANIQARHAQKVAEDQPAQARSWFPPMRSSA